MEIIKRVILFAHPTYLNAFFQKRVMKIISD
jgi:hypothetical protein